MDKLELRQLHATLDMWTHWLLNGGEHLLDTSTSEYQVVRREMAEALGHQYLAICHLKPPPDN